MFHLNLVFVFLICTKTFFYLFSVDLSIVISKQLVFRIFLWISTFSYVSTINSVCWLSCEWIKICWTHTIYIQNRAASTNIRNHLDSRWFVYVRKCVFFFWLPSLDDFFLSLFCCYFLFVVYIRSVASISMWYTISRGLLRNSFLFCSLFTSSHYNFNVFSCLALLCFALPSSNGSALRIIWTRFVHKFFDISLDDVDMNTSLKWTTLQLFFHQPKW